MSSLGYQVASYDQDSAQAQLTALRQLYADVYVEPPYCEGEAEFSAFDERFAVHRDQPGFALVAAWDDGQLLGYLFGFHLAPGSEQYEHTFYRCSDSSDQPPADVAYVSELLVSGRARRRGIAHTLHHRFAGSRIERRLALLAHPEAAPAQNAYHNWGYRKWGEGIPFTGAGIYDTMVLTRPPASGEVQG